MGHPYHPETAIGQIDPEQLRCVLTPDRSDETPGIFKIFYPVSLGAYGLFDYFSAMAIIGL